MLELEILESRVVPALFRPSLAAANINWSNVNIWEYNNNGVWTPSNGNLNRVPNSTDDVIINDDAIESHVDVPFTINSLVITGNSENLILRDNLTINRTVGQGYAFEMHGDSEVQFVNINPQIRTVTMSIDNQVENLGMDWLHGDFERFGFQQINANLEIHALSRIRGNNSNNIRMMTVNMLLYGEVIVGGGLGTANSLIDSILLDETGEVSVKSTGTLKLAQDNSWTIEDGTEQNLTNYGAFIAEGDNRSIGGTGLIIRDADTTPNTTGDDDLGGYVKFINLGIEMHDGGTLHLNYGHVLASEGVLIRDYAYLDICVATTLSADVTVRDDSIFNVMVGSVFIDPESGDYPTIIGSLTMEDSSEMISGDQNLIHMAPLRIIGSATFESGSTFTTRVDFITGVPYPGSIDTTFNFTIEDDVTLNVTTFGEPTGIAWVVQSVAGNINGMFDNVNADWPNQTGNWTVREALLANKEHVVLDPHFFIGDINGTVWLDNNENGVIDGLEGASSTTSVLVDLYDSNGWVASATADSYGNYSFTDVDWAESYTLYFTITDTVNDTIIFTTSEIETYSSTGALDGYFELLSLDEENREVTVETGIFFFEMIEDPIEDPLPLP